MPAGNGSDVTRPGVYDDIVRFVRELYGAPEGTIPLHAPTIGTRERVCLAECVDTTYVSSVGRFVDRFEDEIREFVGARCAVATVNGTAALHTALTLAGVGREDEVITQPLTFVATCNAIAYCAAAPVFVDVGEDTMGLAPEALAEFLGRNCQMRDGVPYNRETGKRLAACVPVHTFGFPCRIREIVAECARYNIPVVEDAAESLGSLVESVHTGLFGQLGVLSFNGNKTVTTGGGGMIITNDEALGRRARHLTTTARCSHPWEISHDAIGFNYRLPNINAALGCAQMQRLPDLLASKRETARRYDAFFARVEGMHFRRERERTTANYWLNTVVLEDPGMRDTFLEHTNARGVLTRPAWTLMPDLDMYRNCVSGDLLNARRLAERIVNLPSSARCPAE